MTAGVRIEQIDAFDGFATLAPASVNLICTSPPYWGLRTYGQEHNADIQDAWCRHSDDASTPPPYEWYRDNGGVLGLEPTPDWYVSNLVEILMQAKPALTPDASLWINLGDTYFARWSSLRALGRHGLGTAERERRRVPSGGYRHDKQLLLIPARFAIAMQERGWILRNDLIWSKPQVAPRPEKDRLRLSHEHFFHFVGRTRRARPTYFYDRSKVEDGALDVVSVKPSSGGEGHPATFPEALVRPRIRSSCPPGGLVCDPFCGLGTTLQVAAETGRRSIGFDVSAAYVRLARDRLLPMTRRSAAS